MKYPAYPKHKASGVEWLGDVPEHWDVKKIKYIIKHIKIGPFGSDLTLDMMTDDGIKVYGQENLINNDFSLGDKFISEKKFEEMKIYTVDKGDILISMMGTIGKCRVVPEKFIKGIINSHLIKMKVNQSVIYPNYLALIISDSGYVDYEINRESVGTIMSGLNSSIVKSLSILLPPLPEQQAIAAFLDRETGRIDTLIDKKQKLIELLKEKRTALISRAVTKGLNPKVKMKHSGVEWLGDVPEHWVVKKIKHLTKVISKGTTPSTEGLEILEDGEIRFIKAENIVENKVSILPEFFIDHKTNSALNRSILQENDVLIVIAGATIGKVAILEKGFLPANTNQAVCFIRLREKQLSKLFWYYMQSDLIKNLVAINSVQSAQPNISMGLLKELIFSMPPLPEQQAIVCYLDIETRKIDSLIAKVDIAIEKLTEYRTALISAVVTGKIDLREVA